MSSFTKFLNLFKWNAIEDTEEEFNIDKALNENWDKIDTKLETYMTNLSNEVNQFTEDTNTTINAYKALTDDRVDELETQISSIKEISISPTKPTKEEKVWIKRGKNLLNLSEMITGTINGITVTKNDDGSITLNILLINTTVFIKCRCPK